MAKDGIVIKARARVTVRTNLTSFVGGATEDTIIARVGEGIVSSIGSEQSYKDVLENPDRISKNVLAKGLDSNTAFEILSIDIADVDVGENIGAKLQAEQAESNKLVAQAQAEVRRAAAVAVEQEMTARVAEMQAKVVEAEAQVPLAMAEAFRSGNLGIMDYYRIKNLSADTDMRSKIAGSDESSDSGKPKTLTPLAYGFTELLDTGLPGQRAPGRWTDIDGTLLYLVFGTAGRDCQLDQQAQRGLPNSSRRATPSRRNDPNAPTPTQARNPLAGSPDSSNLPRLNSTRPTENSRAIMMTTTSWNQSKHR